VEGGEASRRRGRDDLERHLDRGLVERRPLLEPREDAVAPEHRRLAGLQVDVAGAELDGAPKESVEIHRRTRRNRRRRARPLAGRVRSLDSPSEQVDVLVVGAGPAGLAVARATAAAGLTTLVIERQKEIAEHVRTSGMTASSTVRRVGVPPGTYHSLERLRIVAPGVSAAFSATPEAGFC